MIYTAGVVGKLTKSIRDDSQNLKYCCSQIYAVSVYKALIVRSTEEAVDLEFGLGSKFLGESVSKVCSRVPMPDEPSSKYYKVLIPRLDV